MADVAIIHASDKETAASRLAEAIEAAGFGVRAVEIEDTAGLPDALGSCAADVRILIWSRPLVSHALHSGELHRIRQLAGLIEVSADGITPPSRGDEARVVSISGWRGQPFHPGWQRIHLELKRLCGPRKSASEVSAAPRLRPNPAREPATPPPADAGADPRARRLMLGGGTAVLLAAAAVGAATWFGKEAPDVAARQEIGGSRGPANVTEAPRPDVAVAQKSPNASAAPPPIQDPSPLPSSENAAPDKVKPDSPQARPAPKASPPKPARPMQRSSPQAGPVKKYSRKNSKVMRQFCERSGRSTPQCRTFLRSLGSGARASE
ncbi:MAG TPA: hypothetical protein VF574_07820 [Allosphingosinicella sp.]